MLPALPNLSMGSSATGGTARSGASAWGAGDWIVNVAGSGKAIQTASPAPSPLMIAGVVAVLGVAWLLLRRK